MKTYQIVIQDDTSKKNFWCDIQSRDAATAIQLAIERNIGSRVLSCVGKYDRMEYEIPDHKPLTEKPKRTKRVDLTDAMFNEDEIKRESIMAKEKADYNRYQPI